MLGGRRIIEEKNENDIELTKRAFSKNKFENELNVVTDGEEALDYLFSAGDYSGDNAPQKPMLILLDLKLPKVTGLEVLKEIRTKERTRYIPVVVLTSSSEEQDILRSYDLGANSFVRKPVDFSDFIETVKNLGLYWLSINKQPEKES